MSNKIQRRQLLSGLVAGAAALAFDPATGSWIGEAQAALGALAVPGLGGQLLLDEATLSAYADDFGHVVHHAPLAVLRPASIDDVQRMVAFANRHALHVAVRGSGSSAFGQAQARAGIVVDVSSLSAIHEVGADSMVVDAGARWRDVAGAALARGLLPPVLPDHLDTTVGGRLSVGGIGAESHRRGLTADHVRSLEVVTGDGRHVSCSAYTHPELFHAALGGLGQHAIIVKATLALIKASERVRVYTVTYASTAELVIALSALAGDDRFETLRAQITTAPERRWAYTLQATVHRSVAQPSELDARRTFGAHALDVCIIDCRHEEWMERMSASVEYWKSVGLWDVPHPRLDVFLPAEAAEPFLSELLDDLPPEHTADYPLTLTPVLRGEGAPRLAGLPEAPGIALSLLRFAEPERGEAEEMLEANRSLFELARSLGGRSLPTSAVALSATDWVEHYGGAYLALVRSKASFDAKSVLGRSFGPFSRP